MLYVVDSSVIIKWLNPESAGEDHAERASELLRGILEGRDEVIQPTHWLAEVGAVLSRLSAKTALLDIERLHQLELPVRDDSVVYSRAVRLAIESKQHLFDTLYHAVALETDGALYVTADERYCRAAARYSSIVPLSTWKAAKP